MSVQSKIASQEAKTANPKVLAFVEEAKKANLSLDPVSGPEMGKLVADVFTLDAATIAKLKEALSQ